ncbi:lmo0954 family membrane protein [Bacillus sp. T33-2]|uniref:lmo0954 family membrane protein n=1 Tax=Bacillus sp. T33-2 TaxID=2054168 RepID=UPI000C777C23|nr:flagellar basal body rod protein [Bacillus sp. T33-2]PLR96073.1 flagellar basal body rod protein [Bacillus sp. T33-2]
MKKFGLLVAGGIAAMVLISNLGPIIGLGVSLLVLYFVLKQFLKTESTAAKIGWGIAGFIVLMATASNVPAILGIAAAYVLYLVYKKWNDSEKVSVEDNDPFANFEKQWSELKNY